MVHHKAIHFGSYYTLAHSPSFLFFLLRLPVGEAFRTEPYGERPSQVWILGAEYSKFIVNRNISEVSDAGLLIGVAQNQNSVPPFLVLPCVFIPFVDMTPLSLDRGSSKPKVGFCFFGFALCFHTFCGHDPAVS